MRLSDKQTKALELLTSGEGLSYKQISDALDIKEITLYRWRNQPEYQEFQDELKKINEARWQAAEDAAREGCLKLCKDGNQRMIEFVMKNVGYNPTTNLNADISGDINITVDYGNED